MGSSTAPLSRETDRRLLAGVAAALVQIVIGVGLVVAGVAVFLVASPSVESPSAGILATAAIAVGLVMVFGPWWWRLTHDLAVERQERIRTQEKAEVAAHIHDSVLQTLALIQRNSTDARKVSTLARSQERELRAWLFGTPELDAGESLAAAMVRVSDEIEYLYDVAVETVEVGDCPVDERLIALVQSSREALANAAQHSGATSVSAYLEVEPDQVTIFVRDRGSGFELDNVPRHRRGIADSIVGRMDRHGGKAVIRSEPGQGTEVELVMPRS
ncbi:MAG TPA: ATP-binding protein [Acidimicrobiales bacterium]|nr:ATP-binding protein [Acidimicrobiales bacterium]